MSAEIRQMFSWPSQSQWLEACGLLGLFLIIALPFALLSGLFAWSPSASGLWQVALIAFVVPAFLEELMFRAPLLWRQKRGPVFLPSLISLALFVLWHPFNAWLFLPAAWSLFTDPRFLFVAFGLGMTCSFATLRTGSLWPAIAIHWLVVLGWKAGFGGPQFVSIG